jgi:hypothetical protein
MNRDEKLGKLIVLGMVMSGIAIPYTMIMYVFAMGGMILGGGGPIVVMAALGPIAFIVGLGMIAYALFSGFQTNKRATTASARTIASTRVVARFALNPIGEMIFSEVPTDDPDWKLYVRLQVPDGHSEELRCAGPVFDVCGEGLYGTAVVQGDWLGGFSPTPRPAQPLNDYRA